MPVKKEYILCAAIHYEDGEYHKAQPKGLGTGYVMCGRRHHNVILLHSQLTGEPTRQNNSTQGFVTSLDRFVNRVDAMKIAIEAQQVENDDTNIGRRLMSEDLY